MNEILNVLPWGKLRHNKIDCLLFILFLLISLWLFPHQEKAWGQEKDFVVKKIDLSQYGTSASIAQDPKSEQLAIGFNNCNLIFLDNSLNWKDELFLKDCKRFFRARYGNLEGKSLLISSIYTGSSVLSNSQAKYDIPLHKAAVTDSLIIQDYLLSSSDDGTVQISRIIDLSPPQVNTLKLYESIGVARNLAFFRAPNAEVDKVAVSYDSGEITIFTIDRNTLRNPVQPTTFRNINSRVNTFKFTPDGSKLLIGYFTGELVEIDLISGASRTLFKVDSWLNALDINSQNLVAIADDQGFVRIISLATGKVVEEHQISSTGINAIIFTNDQTILAADAAGIVYQGKLMGGH
ncbi:hypothetical protein IQ217_04125 [Synechocystis salina LEGE 00031]|uniref:WD40 repeat domain-containing protein n=1 Tax=Synechocystis salina LEGE 00031 TaxID=1828736 RepID=A0ABR9VPR8_9SYNC|nr:hypothetical protein [Synechocystis salina LEGE 00041]MBE9253061.1 hypothetical protein [Synechocystis salina LEGE 00031]